MREIDFCEVCGKFTEVNRYKRHWICPTCPKSKIDKLIDNDESDILIPEWKPKKIRVRKPKIIDPNKPKKEHKPKVKKEKKKTYKKNNVSCRIAVLTFFNKHKGEVFKSNELWDKFPEYLLTNVKNTLSILTAEGLIYSRKINLDGKVKYSIYSTDKNKVLEFLGDENVTQLIAYINNNYPVTTRKLSEIFPISSEGIAKRLKRVDEIGIFQYMNRNFYFPESKRKSCIETIVQNTFWSNQHKANIWKD